MSNFDSGFTKKVLYLDAGNSSIKGAYKKGVNWKAIHTKEKLSASDLIQRIDEHSDNFSKIILASVRDDVGYAISKQLGHIQLVELKGSDIPPELLDYKTPETLGIDRFLTCYGAIEQTRKAAVVIDAGTALTVDFMNQDGVFHGGVIAPGLNGIGERLQQKAPALPVVEMSIPDTWPGKNTVDSLKWGQAGLYKMALEGMLQKYKAELGDFDLFITGGDGQKVAEWLNWESKIHPFLVFDGMEHFERRVSEKQKTSES